MSKKPVLRLMALVLSAALVFTMMPFTVSVKAAGCTHKHDAECGYVEGRYVADDDLKDSDIEDDDLEDVELENDYVEGVPATSSNMEGHYVEGAPCQHEHDELCGGLTDSGKTPGKSGEESELVVIAEFDELDEDTLYQGYDYGEITSQDDLILPDTLTGLDANDNSITIEGVIWQSDPEFDPAVSIVYPGYIFSIVLPEGYALAEGATAPVISVIIRPEDGMPINPTAGADALVSTINTYSANNKGSNQGFTATASEDGKTVTVTDNTGDTGNPGVTGATNQLALAIDSGVTVVWKATLSGSGVTLISLSGTGTFEVASGGTITSGWGAINTSGKLEISGGTVISTAGATMQAPTIRAGNGSVVTVKSGAVTSTNYLGINVVSGAVAILQGGAVNGAHSEYNAAIGNSGKLYYLGNTSGNNGIYITANGTAYYIGGNSVAARFTNNSGGNLIAFDEPTVTDSSGTHNGNNPAASYVTASFPPQLDLSGANISITPAGTPYTQVGNDIRFTADMNENVTVVVNGATITELDNMTLDTFTASFKVYIDGLGENVSNNITFDNKTVTYGDTYTMAATINGNTSGFSYTYVGISGTIYPSSSNAPTNAGTYEVTAIYSGTNNETGIAMATLYILRKPITGAEVTCSTAFTYNGEYPAVIGNVTVKLNGMPLTNSNWEFSYIPLGATPGNYGFTIVGRGNYDGEATGVYTVIPKPITISNVTATDRDYDGTATVVLSGGMLSGVISGDSANVGFTLGSGTLQDKNAGTNKSVNASITLTGSAAGNYTLTLPTVTVNISPKSATITGLTAGNKVYDGSTAATVNGTAALSANYDGANLTISEGTAAFDNANAGTGKPVTFSGYSLGGMAAGNYTLSAQPASVTADITKKELTITGFDITKVYDGSTSISSLGTLTFSGLVSPETADVDTSGITATYAAATVGTHNITFSSNFGMTGGTAAAGNYTITQPTNITGKITKTFQTTLTIADPGPKTYSSGGTFQLSTQGGNGSGAVTYTVTSGTDVISITGSTVTILKVGTATVTATKAGDNDYEPTTSAPITITVNKATGSFGTVAARNATYTPTLTLANVALPSGYVWNLPGTSLSTGDNQSFAATYTDPSGNYEPAAGNIVVNVAKAEQSALSITGHSGPYIYGGSATLGTTGGTTGGAVTYVSGNTAVATVSGNTVNIVGVGNFTITATMAGNANYNDISVTSVSITVNKANQTTPTISGGNISKIYGDSAFSLSVSGGESTGAYSYTSSNTNVATVDSSGQVTITGVGTTTLSVKKLGDSNYNDSASASVTLTVNKATPAAPTVTGIMTNDGQTYTYTITAPASGALYKMDGGLWRTSPVFSGITPGVGVTHRFYAKLTATATHNESPEGTIGPVSFPRLQQNPPTITYTRSGDWSNGGVTVTITSPATGATYSTDDSTYNTTNPIVFANNVSSATIYVKLDATATHEQSAAASVYIDFTKQDQAAPDAFVLSYSANGDTDYTVTIPATAGAEYSFDGQTWSGINTRTGCHPGDIITGYKRMTETSALNASTATIASVTLPLFQVKMPTAMPNGGNFTTSQSVTLSCTTTGADIYYTTDGTAPTTGSTLYSGAFTITDTTTVKAIAVKAGMTDSEVLTVTFTNSPVLSSDAALSALVISSGTLAPAFNPAVTSYTATVAYSVSSVTVTATANHANATVSGAGTKALVVGANTITITVTAQDGTAKTYTIIITREGSGSSNGGGGGSSSSGGSSSPRYNITTAKQHGMPKVATMTYTGTVQDNQLTGTITKDMIQADVNAAGTDPDGIALTFIITNNSSYNNQTISIAGDALDLLRSSGVKYVQVQTGIFRFHFDSAAIQSLDSQTTGTVTVSAAPVSPLSDAAKAAIGNRPMFDFTIHDSTGSTVTSYGNGTVTRGIRYTADSTENTGSLFIVKIVDGTVQWIDRSSYDNGWMIWSGDSNSVYGVGYKAPAPAFTDTTGHWAKDDIDFAASRGLISGTGAAAFAPDTAITRDDFLMALGRLSGVDVSGYTAGSFTDVPAANPAMPYIEWAVTNNIVQGIGDNSFGLDNYITREQLAVIMVNYAEATNYTLPISRQAITFADDAQISAYAKEAVKSIQQTGVISSKSDNRFDPQGIVTRAESSTILRRFTKLVIDGNTARGWVRNDIGQWQYITPDGRTVAGWLNTASGIWYWFDDKGIMAAGEWIQISGKWYYFYDDGQMAANTTIDGYEVSEDGARKE